MADSPFTAAFPIKMDYSLSGPAAGAFANEAIGAWRDAKDRSDLSNDLDYAKRKLEYETQQKDVPLKDIQRENAIEKEKVVSDLYNKGLISQQAIAESKGAISKATAQMSKDQMSMAEDKALPWAYAASALDKDFNPANAGKYQIVKQQMKTQYNIDLPDTYDQQTHAMLMGRGAMSGIALKHFQEMEKEQLKADTAINVAGIGAQSRFESALVSGGNRPPEDNRSQLAAIRAEATSPQGASPQRILEAFQAHVQSMRPKVKEDINKEIDTKRGVLVRMKATNPKAYAVEAAKMGLPASVDPAIIATKQEEQEILNDQIKDFATSFASGKIRASNGTSVPITPDSVGMLVKRGVVPTAKVIGNGSAPQATPTPPVLPKEAPVAAPPIMSPEEMPSSASVMNSEGPVVAPVQPSTTPGSTARGTVKNEKGQLVTGTITYGKDGKPASFEPDKKK